MLDRHQKLELQAPRPGPLKIIFARVNGHEEFKPALVLQALKKAEFQTLFIKYNDFFLTVKVHTCCKYAQIEQLFGACAKSYL